MIERKRRATARVEAAPFPENSLRHLCGEISLDLADEFEQIAAEWRRLAELAILEDVRAACREHARQCGQLARDARENG